MTREPLAVRFWTLPDTIESSFRVTPPLATSRQAAARCPSQLHCQDFNLKQLSSSRPFWYYREQLVLANVLPCRLMLDPEVKAFSCKQG